MRLRYFCKYVCVYIKSFFSVLFLVLYDSLSASRYLMDLFIAICVCLETLFGFETPCTFIHKYSQKSTTLRIKCNCNANISLNKSAIATIIHSET